MLEHLEHGCESNGGLSTVGSEPSPKTCFRHGQTALEDIVSSAALPSLVQLLLQTLLLSLISQSRSSSTIPSAETAAPAGLRSFLTQQELPALPSSLRPSERHSLPSQNNGTRGASSAPSTSPLPAPPGEN